ncbi:hypothetical protein FOG51_02917 [Hanseniaspora uvarum]|nr:hypothetical protein FOG51_02917 [Hanseniaspora uvarum]
MLLKTSTKRDVALFSNTIKSYYSTAQHTSEYLNYNPNDIYSPFYIPTDNHLISAYTKHFYYRNLAAGDPVFHAMLRDPQTHKPNGFQTLTIDNRTIPSNMQSVSYPRWIASLQESLIKKNFVEINEKLDDTQVEYIDVSKNKFDGQLNLHPFVDVSITEELVDKIIANCISNSFINDAFDTDSFIDFFLFLVKDKEFYLKNQVVIHNSILKHLFNGIPESTKLSNFFVAFLNLLYKENMINLKESNKEFNSIITQFANQYYQNLAKVNIDGLGISSNFLSFIMDFHVNIGNHKKAFHSLKQIMHHNGYLPRSNHLSNYIRNINDPAMLSGVVSALRFDTVNEQVYDAIIDKLESFDQIKFILDINPIHISKNIHFLNSTLKKMFELRENSTENLKTFSEFLNYILKAFRVQEFMLSTKDNKTVYLNILKALKLSGNYYLINKYLNKYNLTEDKNQNLKSKIQKVMRTTPSSTELFETQVLQNGFIEIVNKKLDL